MRYEHLPKLSQWKSDAFQLFKPPVKPEVTEVLQLFEKYESAFTPMARRNMLRALAEALKGWKATSGPAPFAWTALNEVANRTVHSKFPATYSQVVCIGYKFNVGKWDKNAKVKYAGKLDDMRDMKERAATLMKAIQSACNSLSPDESRSNVLKIFMGPEFYFRGAYGAYPPDVVSEIIPTMRGLGTDSPIFKDWLFVFGTAISASIDARHYCHTCNKSDSVIFQPDPLNAGKTKGACSKGAGHDVREEVFGAVIDNVALIQRKGEEYLVAKEYVSHIDFRSYQVNVPLKPGGARTVVDVLAPEGARPRSASQRDASVPSSEGSHKKSKYVDERMGGAIFSFDGITFGLEVCLDHVESGGRLNGVQVQILLIPSAGMNINCWNTVDDGITFNVDGLRPAQGTSAVELRVKSGAGALEVGTSVRVGSGKGSVESFGPFDIPY